MLLKKIALTAAAATALFVAYATPGFASQPPGGGGGAGACVPYITSIYKSGNTLHWTTTTYNCDSQLLILEMDQWDATRTGGPGGEGTGVCRFTTSSTCSISLTKNISSHPGDKYCAGTSVEYTLVSGGERCT